MGKSDPARLTQRQRLALTLCRQGLSHAQIAQKLDIRHRQVVSRLIARARAAEAAIRLAAEQFLDQ